MTKMNAVKKLLVLFTLILGLTAVSAPAFAAEEPAAEEAVLQQDSSVTGKAMAAALVVGVAAAVGAISMGISICKSAESIARQPEAGGQIRSGMMLGLVFIETAIIYALIVAILIIFVM